VPLPGDAAVEAATVAEADGEADFRGVVCAVSNKQKHRVARTIALEKKVLSFMA